MSGTSLLITILVIVIVASFFVALIANYIYRKRHNLPTGDCAMCHTSGKHKKNALVKAYHKTYHNK